MFKPCDLDQLRHMFAIANRAKAMMHRRAVEAYYEAFHTTAPRDACLDMCVIHNSLISAEEGKPWREVHYPAMRRARCLVDKSFEPGRIVGDWYRRKCSI